MAKTVKKGKCKKCPETKPDAMLTSQTEGERLWKHVCVGASTCINMIEQYAKLGMKGFPAEELRSLKDRLERVLDQ
jgi:hypothetical protein